MLLRFSVENVYSFADEVSLSMVASGDDKHPGHRVVLRENYRFQALRTTALYGANAHGKTNLIEAMSLARSLIVEGRKPGQPMPVEQFRLDPQYRDKPSKFEFVIFWEGIEYTYGFILDSRRILEEWLFARPKMQEVRYFERLTDSKGKIQVEFGPSLTRKGTKDEQFLDFVARGTRENQLFLTEAVDRNVKKLAPVYQWFREILTIVPTHLPVQPIELRAIKEDRLVDFIGGFLRKAGTGIEGISAEEEPLDFEKYFPGLPQDLRIKFEEEVKNGKALSLATGDGASFAIYPGDDGPRMVRLRTIHKCTDGSAVHFDFEDESSGTQRIMQILPVLADLGSGCRVYVIDELDRKLHPLLSRLFVESFLNLGEGDSSQLIFTTHETSLLDLELLRRDEIWFVEKDKIGSSHLYSLASLKVRPDLKIERGYLQGRFGAIPFVGDVNSLGW